MNRKELITQEKPVSVTSLFKSELRIESQLLLIK